MKLFTAKDIAEIDSYTEVHEPISSIDLMERAATAMFHQFIARFDNSQSIVVVAGRGNNGGDALAMARMFTASQYKVTVIAFPEQECKPNTQTNLRRLHEIASAKNLTISTDITTLPFHLSQADIIIDGLLGTGITREVLGLEQKIIAEINNAGKKVVSIDIPSGLSCENNANLKQDNAVKANITLTIQFPKISCMFPENGRFVGEMIIVSIGLDKTKIEQQPSPFHYVELDDIVIKPRPRFAHKGMFGHVLVIAGEFGKMGACVLAAKSCLRTGAGLVTAMVPRSGVTIMQIAIPEVMVTERETIESTITAATFSLYKTMLLGPGIGVAPETQKMVLAVLHTNIPMVIDADGLNCIAINKNWIEHIPEGTIITPHIKEFERLFGTSPDSYSRMQKQIERSQSLAIYIVLKGHRTCITTPQGQVFFNSTGNAGMATAGSGDVLSGIISSLLAQGYCAQDAACFGVFLHGLAGDCAMKKRSQESMIASDIIDSLSDAISFAKR